MLYVAQILVGYLVLFEIIHIIIWNAHLRLLGFHVLRTNSILGTRVRQSHKAVGSVGERARRVSKEHDDGTHVSERWTDMHCALVSLLTNNESLQL